MKDPTNPGAIVGRQEAAEVLGVSRQRLSVLTDGSKATGSRPAVEPDPNFPAPICSIDDGARPLWWRRAIEDYARDRKGRSTRVNAPQEPVAA